MIDDEPSVDDRTNIYMVEVEMFGGIWGDYWEDRWRGALEGSYSAGETGLRTRCSKLLELIQNVLRRL